MPYMRQFFYVLTLGVLIAALGGCRREAEESKSKAKQRIKAIDATPAGHPMDSAPSPLPSVTPASDDQTLRLDGIAMTVPTGWGQSTRQSGQFSTKTILALPKADGDEKDGTVEITHFPGMKGMDDQNIGRWIASVARTDGSAHTRETAQLRHIEVGAVRITLVDLEGTVRTSMFGAGGGLPDHRMIAAIVDHPRGPHFVKAVSGEATMARWSASVEAFLRSAAPTGD